MINLQISLPILQLYKQHTIWGHWASPTNENTWRKSYSCIYFKIQTFSCISKNLVKKRAYTCPNHRIASVKKAFLHKVTLSRTDYWELPTLTWIVRGEQNLQVLEEGRKRWRRQQHHGSKTWKQNSSWIAHQLHRLHWQQSQTFTIRCNTNSLIYLPSERQVCYCWHHRFSQQPGQYL